jgi:hypothetical protein
MRRRAAPHVICWGPGSAGRPSGARCTSTPRAAILPRNAAASTPPADHDCTAAATCSAEDMASASVAKRALYLLGPDAPL